MKRTLKVRVGSVASALDRFEETWRKAARGEKAPAEHVLTFTSLQLLLRTLTPARWTLLERLRAGERAGERVGEGEGCAGALRIGRTQGGVTR